MRKSNNGRWWAGPAREVLTGETPTELYLTPITEIAAQGRRNLVISKRAS
jgi:hypothetical protein